MSTLQEKLLELGFLDVTGTTECCGGSEKVIGIALPDQRLRCDSNNGVRVVVDDHGHFWIQPYQMNKDSAELTAMLFALACGAHVPHSNDGGKFVRSVWPWLYQERERNISRYPGDQPQQGGPRLAPRRKPDFTPIPGHVTIVVRGREVSIPSAEYDPRRHGPAKLAPPENEMTL